MASPPVPQDPKLPKGFSLTFKDRFWAKVNKTESCWLWTACKNNHGHGQIKRGLPGAGHEMAMRASWILHFGSMPKGGRVHHTCTKSPGCVRPDHLWLESLDVITEKECRRCHKVQPIAEFLKPRRGKFLN